MKTITVHGMHCGACEKLITMELADAGLDTCVERVDIYGEEKKGVLYLQEDTSDEQVEEIKRIIKSMEGYAVE